LASSTAVALLALAGSAGAAPGEPRVAGSPPVVFSPPIVTGDASEGQILSATPGRWTARGTPLVFVFRWERCASERGTCVPVAGANDRLYVLGADDIGHTARVVVTASNEAGGRTAVSARTAGVAPSKPGSPLSAAPPIVSGTPEKGALLTVEAGTWTGTEPLLLTYRWRRCNALGGACDELGRRGPKYRVRVTDVGHTLRALVFAENSIETGAALSEPTRPVGPLPPDPPSSTALPAITGVAEEGAALVATTGAWRGASPMRFSFRWLRCRGDGRACPAIAGATAQSYTPDGRDVGRVLRVRVTATNVAGRASAVSAGTDPVVGTRSPVNTSAPTISGDARAGTALSASSGSWRGAQPMRFSFRWHRCASDGGSCKGIGGASHQTYLLTPADVGHRLRVRVIAANSTGDSSALSAPSAVVAGQGSPPVLRARPVLAGNAIQGSRLTLSAGGWSGPAPLALAYGWKRCDASLRDCVLVPGANRNVYVVSRADVAHRLVGVVTARNRFGAGRAESGATAIVVGAPTVAARPTITGASVEGEVLRASFDRWTGPGPVSFGYQWTRCAASGVFATCVPVVVTHNPTYVVRAADVGHRIFVQVKATNRYGASYANSAQTAVIVAAPVGALTISVTRTIVTYGSPAVLTGVLVRGAEELVTILARPPGAETPAPVRSVVTSPSGGWRCVTEPTSRTVYQAQAGDRTSALVVVSVRPRLRLRRVAPGRFVVRVFAARAFVGRQAVLQRWDPRRRRWAGMKRFRLGSSRPGLAPTAITSGVVRTRAKRGRVVRVVLPNRQSGPGYLQGVSNRVRDRSPR
jgi:hypothetical protein